MSDISGTYNFQSVEIEKLIREAYENIGISPEFITPQKLESARCSINLILLEWMNKTTNLWTIRQNFLSLNEYQQKYTLENYVSDLTNVFLRTSIRQLNGAASSSNAGIADNAFDGNTETACTQDAVNGNISYDYGEGFLQTIVFFGITSNKDSGYTLHIESSNNNANWNEILTIPQQSYIKGEVYWFDITKPESARYFRVRESGGATLDIQEIYFNNNLLDTTLSAISRCEYLQLPQKDTIGRSTSYYFDRAITPSINLWPAPTSFYSVISYSYKKMMQDVGLYTNAIEIPSRFYPALTCALSYRLAIKFNAQLSDMLRAEALESFAIAAMEDTENMTITIRPNTLR